MAFKLNSAKSEVLSGAKDIATKRQNLSQTNYDPVNSLSIQSASKQQLWQPNKLEPCQRITTKKNIKQPLTANIIHSQNIRKSNSSTQSTNFKLTTMEEPKFTKSPISSATAIHRHTSLTTTKQLQNSYITSNKQSTRLTQSSARSTSSNKSPLSAPWKSPFKTFITTGINRTHNQYGCQPQEFSYDLSPDELKFVNTLKSPMKPAPEQERQLLINGQRMEYLNQRYEHSPYCKYNYPEATSWRIGWLQQENSLGHGIKN